MSVLSSLARRWADKKLIEEADDLRYGLVMAQAAVERLTQERDSARKSLDGAIATSDVWEKAYGDRGAELAELRGQLDAVRVELGKTGAELSAANFERDAARWRTRKEQEVSEWHRVIAANRLDSLNELRAENRSLEEQLGQARDQLRAVEREDGALKEQLALREFGAMP